MTYDSAAYPHLSVSSPLGDDDRNHISRRTRHFVWRQPRLSTLFVSAIASNLREIGSYKVFSRFYCSSNLIGIKII